MDLNVFINSLFSWGQDMFSEALEIEVREKVLQLTKNADEAHYFEIDIRNKIYNESGFSTFPCPQKLTRTEVVSYIDSVTKGFNPIYVDSLLEDIKQAGRLYYQKILRTTKYIQEYVLPITDNIWVELTFDSFKAISGKACCEALGLDNSLYHYVLLFLSSGTTENLKRVFSPELDTPQLLPILERGQKAGFLDEEYKPIPGSMTRPQQKRFALLACIEAGLDNYCSRFGQMWGCNYNGVDESRGAVQKREAIDSLFAQDIINKAKLK